MDGNLTQRKVSSLLTNELLTVAPGRWREIHRDRKRLTAAAGPGCRVLPATRSPLP
jgi:hypothetical protein